VIRNRIIAHNFNSTEGPIVFLSAPLDDVEVVGMRAIVLPLLVTAAVVKVPPLIVTKVTPPEMDTVVRPSAAVVVIGTPPVTEVLVTPPTVCTSVSTVTGMKSRSRSKRTSQANGDGDSSVGRNTYCCDCPYVMPV
jgi:hypothetical protein